MAKTIDDFEVPKGYTLVNDNSFMARIGKCESCKLKAENKQLQTRLGAAEKKIEQLKKAIESYGKNPAGFDWGVLDKIDTLEAKIEQQQNCIRDLIIAVKAAGGLNAPDTPAIIAKAEEMLK